jgi:glycosyltransferase involved in cell wall biosynthesis
MAKNLAESAPTLSVILIVRNEAHCLARCLRSISPIADEIIVLDSGSTDQTVSIARSFGAKVEVTDWPGFGPQKNRALDRARGEWVLAIDADEHVTPRLVASIRAAVEAQQANVNGYFIRFLATWCGKPVYFGDWGHKRHLRLFRRTGARFTDVLVHEGVICQSPYGTLDGVMIHDTIASEEEALEKTRRYAELGAQNLRARGRGGLLSALFHSAWTLQRGYLLKGGFLDGATGWKVAWTTTSRTWLRYRLAGQRSIAGRETSATAGLWKLAPVGMVKSAVAAARNKMIRVAANTFGRLDQGRIGHALTSFVRVALVIALLLTLDSNGFV